MSVPGILTGGVVGAQATSRVWLIGLVTSGMANCEDVWEEVANGLEESSTLEDSEAPRDVEASLSRVELPEA